MLYITNIIKAKQKTYKLHDFIKKAELSLVEDLCTFVLPKGELSDVVVESLVVVGVASGDGAKVVVVVVAVIGVAVGESLGGAIPEYCSVCELSLTFIWVKSIP